MGGRFLCSSRDFRSLKLKSTVHFRLDFKSLTINPFTISNHYEKFHSHLFMTNKLQIFSSNMNLFSELQKNLRSVYSVLYARWCSNMQPHNSGRMECTVYLFVEIWDLIQTKQVLYFSSQKQSVLKDNSESEKYTEHHWQEYSFTHDTCCLISEISQPFHNR